MSERDISDILDTAPFRRTDIVSLLSGGLPMVVSSVQESIGPGGWTCTVVWMDQAGHLQTRDIAADLLMDFQEP